MELRHLRYFVAVAETGSLSRAAAKLFVAQPPLSVQIRQLEQTLGAPLFTRHPKGVRLTAAGSALLPQARDLLDRAARLADIASIAGHGETLTLGYVPSTSSTVLPELVRRLRARHPRLDLQLRELITSEQVDALVAGQIDAGVARSPARHPRLTVRAEAPDPFGLALAAGRADRADGADAGPVDLRHYAGADFVAFTRHRGPAYFDRAIHLCSRAGFSPRIRYEASTVHGVLDLVGAGLGVALVPSSAALLATPHVSVRPLGRAPGAETLALVRRRGDESALLDSLDAAVRVIFDALVRRVGSRVGAAPAAARARPRPR